MPPNPITTSSKLNLNCQWERCALQVAEPGGNVARNVILTIPQQICIHDIATSDYAGPCSVPLCHSEARSIYSVYSATAISKLGSLFHDVRKFAVTLYVFLFAFARGAMS